MVKQLSLIAAFAATIPAANWLIGNVGTECIPNGPCLLPVGFGLAAPSGVLVVGAALVLRANTDDWRQGAWAEIGQPDPNARALAPSASAQGGGHG